MTSFSKKLYPKEASRKNAVIIKAMITSIVETSMAKTFLKMPAVTKETAAVAINMSIATDKIKINTAKRPSFR